MSTLRVFLVSVGNGELILAKWLSVMYHLQNVHSNFDSELYSECSHAEDLENRPWLQPGEKRHIMGCIYFC